MNSQKLKTVKLKITEEESKAITSVLIDALDYYSSLPKKEEKMELLVKASKLCFKITESFYN